MVNIGNSVEKVTIALTENCMYVPQQLITRTTMTYDPRILEGISKTEKHQPLLVLVCKRKKWWNVEYAHIKEWKTEGGGKDLFGRAMGVALASHYCSVRWRALVREHSAYHLRDVSVSWSSVENKEFISLLM